MIFKVVGSTFHMFLLQSFLFMHKLQICGALVINNSSFRLLRCCFCFVFFSKKKGVKNIAPQNADCVTVILCDKKRENSVSYNVFKTKAVKEIGPNIISTDILSLLTSIRQDMAARVITTRQTSTTSSVQEYTLFTFDGVTN